MVEELDLGGVWLECETTACDLDCMWRKSHCVMYNTLTLPLASRLGLEVNGKVSQLMCFRLKIWHKFSHYVGKLMGSASSKLCFAFHMSFLEVGTSIIWKLQSIPHDSVFDIYLTTDAAHVGMGHVLASKLPQNCPVWQGRKYVNKQTE